MKNKIDMKKSSLKTLIFIKLRKLGMLCKKPQPYKPTIRIAKTVYPDIDMAPIDREVYVYLSSKAMSNPNCKFDPAKKTCVCGISVEKFGEKGCKNK